MVALLRLSVFGLLALTLIYLVAAAYFGSLHRERLERDWEAAPEGSREDFVAAGMKAWRRGPRHRLLLAIYLGPVAAVAAIIYWLNFT